MEMYNLEDKVMRESHRIKTLDVFSCYTIYLK